MFSKLFCLGLVSLLAAESGKDLQIITAIEQNQLVREERLLSYTVTEHYTLRNTRFHDPAEMTVAVSYARGRGKVYDVQSRSGPSFLQTGVLDRVLKEEQSMSQGEAREASLVTSANYRMKWAGEQQLGARNCETILLEPRKKTPHLLQGKAWADASNFRLVRIEGKPAASPSFWAGSPWVVRDYKEIGDFSFAVRSQATSQSFLLGRSELIIDYIDYRVSVESGSK